MADEPQSQPDPDFKHLWFSPWPDDDEPRPHSDYVSFFQAKKPRPAPTNGAVAAQLAVLLAALVTARKRDEHTPPSVPIASSSADGLPVRFKLVVAELVGVVFAIGGCWTIFTADGLDRLGGAPLGLLGVAMALYPTRCAPHEGGLMTLVERLVRAWRGHPQ